MAQLQAWAPDLIVVAAFGQILRPAVLDMPRYGCVNVHGSLLPRWRGAAPIQAAILAGDKETGITIMKMDSGVDTGPMLSQRAMPIKPDDTAGSLFERMSMLGAKSLMETLPSYLDGLIQPRPQPEEGMTYAPMLKKEDGLLDFTRSAEELVRRIRAFNPWPGTYFEWQGGLIKVHAAHVVEGTASSGERLIFQKSPAVGTGKGILVLDEIQPAGKKPMPGKAFLSGAKWEN
jgi:methionyl-tRNA formyltransferase